MNGPLPAPLPVRTALLAVLCTLSPGVGAASGTIAHWTFEQATGPIVDTRTPDDRDDATGPRGSDGQVGYSPDEGDDGEVDRDGSRAAFNGQRDSIILIDGARHTDFNPGAGSLAVTVQFVIDRSVLDIEALGPNETWNLVQKGRFNNAGGQWKLQIRKNRSERVFFQCLVNDEEPDTPRAAAQIAMSHAWILDGDTIEGRCTLDRENDALRVELTDTTRGIDVLQVTKSLPAGFGAVAPRAGRCGSPESFGENVAIGNKPICPDQELDTDDAFRGEVHGVRLDRP